MTKFNSVGLRRVGWLKRFRDHVAEKLVQGLRRGEVQPHTRCDLNNGLVVGIDNKGTEGQGYDAQILASLQNQIHVVDGSTLVPNISELISQRETPPAPNHHLIAHQKSPIGKVYDLSSLNAKSSGVQS